MSYKITITKTEVETKIVRGEYTKTGEREEEGDYSKEIKMVPSFGYAPDRENEVKTITDVYEQVVEELDVGSLVKFINTPMVKFVMNDDGSATEVK